MAASVQKLGLVIVGNVDVCKKLTFDKLVHDTNADEPIVVTEFGIVTEVRLVQLWNALVPILVTELGIVTEVRPVQLWNALVPIVVSPNDNVTEVIPVQRWNALVPILVTELGIITEVRTESWNVYVEILVTLYIIPLGSVIVLGIVITPVADELYAIAASVTLVL